MDIEKIIINGDITVITKNIPEHLSETSPKPNPGEVESVSLRLTDGSMAQFDITDRGEGWIRFDSYDCLGKAPWNENGGNLNGNIENASITEYIIAKIEPKLPEWLYEMITPTERFTGEEDIYAAKLFLPDASEVFGEDDWHINRYDRLDYYKDPHHRIKATEPGGEEPSSWWTASAHSGGATGCVSVDASGLSDYDAAPYAIGVPVCFRINKADLRRLISEALNSGGTIRRIQL